MKILKWGWLLCKRLYKKVTFLIILLLIPLSVFSFGRSVDGESGFVIVALTCLDEGDDLSSAVTEELLASRGLMRFLPCDSPQQAREWVESGQVDAAWILSDRLRERIAEFFLAPQDGALVTVLERESTVPLHLSHEKLSGVLFEACSQQAFLNYVRRHAPAASEVSDEDLLHYYKNAFTGVDTLFSFSDAHGVPTSDDGREVNYLTAPLRGLLAVVMALCAFASAMYYVQDRERGLFSLLPEKSVPYVECGYHFVTVLNVSIACFVALAVAGQIRSYPREMLILLLYIPCVAVFACFVRCLFDRVHLLGVALPLAAVGMIALCPVFFDWAEWPFLQVLFPPTYFVRAGYCDPYLLYVLLYSLILWGAYRLIGRLRRG